MKLFSIRACMSVSLCGSLVAGSVHAQMKTQGNCSPVFEQSQVTGHVTLICGAGRADLARLVERVNRLIDESRTTRTQINELIQVLTGYGEARVGRSRLGSVMTTYLTTVFQNIFPDDNVGLYIAYGDPSDKRIAGADADSAIYVLIAARAKDERAEDGQCLIGNNAVMFGFKISTTRITVGQARVVKTILPSSDLVFKRMCQTLAEPFSRVFPETAAFQGATERSMFDYLAVDNVGIEIIVGAGSNAGDNFRTTWAQAFVDRLVGANSDVDLSPQAFARVAGSLDTDGDAVPGAPAAMILTGLPLDFEKANPSNPYPDSVLSDFNPDLEKMDAAWLRYINNRTVMIRGQPLKLIDDGRSISVLRTFKFDELGTRAFWLSIKDPISVMRQETCQAARFAIENGYVAVGDVPGYRKCGARIYAN